MVYDKGRMKKSECKKQSTSFSDYACPVDVNVHEMGFTKGRSAFHFIRSHSMNH